MFKGSHVQARCVCLHLLASTYAYVRVSVGIVCVCVCVCLSILVNLAWHPLCPPLCQPVGGGAYVSRPLRAVSQAAGGVPESGDTPKSARAGGAAGN